MTQTLHRPTVVSRERHNLAADAFLAAAAIFLVVIGTQELLAYLVSGGDMESWTPPVWIEVVGMLGMPLALVGGPLIAWRLYGRHIERRDLLAAVVGAVVGSALFSMVFMVLVLLTRPIDRLFPQEGPWSVVIVGSIAAVVFLAKPVIVAVRDLAGPREHPRRHALRLGILALALVVIVVSVFIGGETAELGMFLALPAVPAALAVVAMDWWREQQHNR